MIIPHIAYAEFQQLPEVIINDLIRDLGLVLVFNAHEMLFCLVAGKDDHFLRQTGLAGKQSLGEDLSERTRSARNDHGLVFE